MQHKRSQLDALTGLRFVAAAVVVAHHFALPEAGLLKNFVAHGFIGVTLFFVLSGFILFYTYGSEPGEIKGSKSAFWLARFARVYPMYLVAMILYAPIAFVWNTGSTSVPVSSAPLSLFLVQAWAEPSIRGAWNPPGWSLSAEAFFYLLFPLLSVLLSKCSRMWLVFLGALMWLVSSLATLSYITDGSVDRDFWMFLPLFRLPEFVLGIIGGMIWQNRKTALFDAVAPYTGLGALTALFALMCSPLDDAYFFNGACALLVVLLICSLACQRGWLASSLSSKPLVLLGGASYSLYILHWPLWYEVGFIFRKLQIEFASPWGLFAAYFCISTLAAYICFRYIEEPTSRRLRKWLNPNGAGRTICLR